MRVGMNLPGPFWVGGRASCGSVVGVVVLLVVIAFTLTYWPYVVAVAGVLAFGAAMEQFFPLTKRGKARKAARRAARENRHTDKG